MREKEYKKRSNTHDCLKRDFHVVVDGVSRDKLSPEDKDLCRFMVGGMQAK
ncbi:MAG: hypothetical protein JW705_01595 [Methanosarcinaceae archaeon]|nr:hypothetical protein [Methanosarcinaceae archaeon]